ncbi:MAG: glycoside hydrolase family protein [Microcoleus sp.]
MEPAKETLAFKTVANKIPQDAITYIQLCEKVELSPYIDSQGIPTIGWGQTYYSNGNRVSISDRPISLEFADEEFRILLERDFWVPLSKTIPHWETMPDEVRSALLDLNYNEGYTYRDGDHDSLDRCLEDRNYAILPKILLKYRNPGQPDELGLARRRYGAGLMVQGVGAEVAHKAAWAKKEIKEII